jgi:hypothetical protein
MAMAMELLCEASPQAQVGNVGVVCEDCGVWSLDGMHGLSLISQISSRFRDWCWAGMELMSFGALFQVSANCRGEISLLQKPCVIAYRRTTFSVVAAE